MATTKTNRLDFEAQKFREATALTHAAIQFNRLQDLRRQHEQCRKAFVQNPTPRLGSALKQLEASIKYEERLLRKKG